MGTQKEIAKKVVVDNNADYVLCVKENQKTLHSEVEEYFEDLEDEGVLDELKKENQGLISLGNTRLNEGVDIYKTKEKDHGRIEERTYYYSTDINWMLDAKKDWENLNGIGMVERQTTSSNGEVTFERSFYIGSIYTVQDFASAVRSHWGIESMHWSLDVTFRDDENRTRTQYGPQNMALLKRMAFNILKREDKIHPSYSKSRKRLVANGDLTYRDTLIS